MKLTPRQARQLGLTDKAPKKRKPPKPLEKDIQKAILQYLHAKGVFCWRQNQGAMKGEYKGKKRFMRFASVKGISDIIGIWGTGRDGRFLAIEVKRPGEVPSPDQNDFLNRITEKGGIAILAYCVDDVASSLFGESLG